ncbi:hypothetical protein [Pseudocolwellia agarivorans]|uniref:hypothetical protein n=1 Tax=Pseudocolwellia agarivorans TaxID=1911682 RepID=UPI000B5AE455|nr:hypothetical protein [Pseudocolwellia agarivorans]
MTKPFSYSHTFILDKAHFNECYSQSVVNDQSLKAYFKAIILSVFGMLLVLLSDVNPYAAWFVFALGILEAVSIYYRQAWWVMRQLLGKSAKGEVTLIIDDKGIATESFYVKNMVLWDNILGFKKTPLGWVVSHEMGNNYISDSCLSAQASELFNEQLASFNAKSTKQN